MNLQLIDNKDPVLHTESKNFDFESPEVDPLELANSMIDFMIEQNGIGLAAPQVGLPYKMFVLRGSPNTGIPHYAVFNPNIVYYSDETVTLEEGCLSYPNLLIKIKRPLNIRARFMTQSGKFSTEKFTGLSARVFQHEYDHIHGINHINRANQYHRQSALKKAKLNKKRGNTYSYKVDDTPAELPKEPINE